MKISLQNFLTLCVSLSSLLLISCGGGSSNNALPPPPRVIPTGSITITAQLGPIQNADVVIYNYSKGTKTTDDVISQASQATDANGQFTIDIQSDSTPILVCISNGSYFEEASDVNNKVEVTLSQDDLLCTVTQYESGSNINLNITFYTHLAYGLANNKLSNAASINDAILQANETISDWLGITVTDLINLKPVQISNVNSIPADLTNPLSAKHKYGFANAALSQLIKWVANKNNIKVFTNITSITFAQRAFDDISADGILNGKAGVNQLTIVEPITEDLYRHKLALNMLIMASSTENNSTLTVDDIFDFADKINIYPNVFISPTPTTILSKGKPNVDVTKPSANDIIFGNALIDSASNAFIAAAISDVAGIQSVIVQILQLDGSIQSTITTNSLSQIKTPFNSILIPDGNYNLNITATNVLGISTSFNSIPVLIENTAISVNIDNPIANSDQGSTAIIVTGVVNEPATAQLQSVVLKLNGKLLAFDNPIDLANTTNTIKATIDSITAQGLTDGPQILELTAISSISNRTQATDSVTFNIDNTKPTVNLSSNSIVQANHVFTQAGAIPIIFNLGDPLVPANTGYSSGLDYAELFISGLLVGNRISNVTPLLSVPFNPLIETNGIRDYPDGWQEMILNVYDKVGNQTQNNTIIGIDTKAPTIKLDISSSQNGIWVNTPLFKGVAFDNPGTGIKNIEIFEILASQNPLSIYKITELPIPLDLPINSRKLSLPFIYQPVIGLFSDGNHKFKINVTDFSDQIGEKIFEFNIDITQPNLTIVSNQYPTEEILLNSVQFKINCILDLTSVDPGYSPTMSTASGLFQEEIYIADYNNTYSTTPSITIMPPFLVDSVSRATTIPMTFDYKYVEVPSSNGTSLELAEYYSREIKIVTRDNVLNNSKTTIVCLDIYTPYQRPNSPPPPPNSCTHRILDASTLSIQSNLVVEIPVTPCK